MSNSKDKTPVLLYLYAEPTEALAITRAKFDAHRAEIEAFTAMVAGSKVRFASCSWREWLSTFPDSSASHADGLIAKFHP